MKTTKSEYPITDTVIPNIDCNLPETLTEKEQAFLALLYLNPKQSNHAIGQRLVNLGVYAHYKSAYDILKNPVVKAKSDEIRNLDKDIGYQGSIKSKLIIHDELDRIAQIESGKREKEDRMWVSMGLKAAPQESSQVNVQVNIEERRRNLLERARQARAEGKEIVVKGK